MSSAIPTVGRSGSLASPASKVWGLVTSELIRSMRSGSGESRQEKMRSRSAATADSGFASKQQAYELVTKQPERSIT